MKANLEPHWRIHEVIDAAVNEHLISADEAKTIMAGLVYLATEGIIIPRTLSLMNGVDYLKVAKRLVPPGYLNDIAEAARPERWLVYDQVRRGFLLATQAGAPMEGSWSWTLSTAARFPLIAATEFVSSKNIGRDEPLFTMILDVENAT